MIATSCCWSTTTIHASIMFVNVRTSYYSWKLLLLCVASRVYSH